MHSGSARWAATRSVAHPASDVGRAGTLASGRAARRGLAEIDRPRLPVPAAAPIAQQVPRVGPCPNPAGPPRLSRCRLRLFGEPACYLAIDVDPRTGAAASLGVRYRPPLPPPHTAGQLLLELGASKAHLGQPRQRRVLRTPVLHWHGGALPRRTVSALSVSRPVHPGRTPSRSMLGVRAACVPASRPRPTAAALRVDDNDRLLAG
jgi:hypothetical protein